MGPGRVGMLARRMLLAVLVLAAGYVALAWYVGKVMPASLQVENVDVGGVSPAEASQRLARALAPKTTAMVRVELADTGGVVSVQPAAAGLGLDIEGSLEGLSGVTLDPGRVWSHLTEPVQRPVRTVVDRQRLTAVLTERAAAQATPAVEGSVSLRGGVVTTTSPRSGIRLNVADAVDKIARSWPRRSTVTASLVVAEPRVGQAALDEVVRDFAVPAMSAPVTLAVGERSAVLTPSQLAAAITISPDETGRLVPEFDRAAIATLVRQATAPLLAPAADAAAGPAGGPPQQQAAAPVALDPAQATDQVIAALTAADRTVRLVPTAP